MATPAADSTCSGAVTAAAAAKLRDEALAAAKLLEDEAASLRSTNAERGNQLLEDVELLKSAAAAQDRVRAAANALVQERAEAYVLEQRAAALRGRSHPTGPRDDDSQADEDDSSLTSDVAAISRLHSQAVAVQNIWNLISVTLDL
jgi:hypothetical protein